MCNGSSNTNCNNSAVGSFKRKGTSRSMGAKEVIGSGGGNPHICLKIVQAGHRVTLVDTRACTPKISNSGTEKFLNH